MRFLHLSDVCAINMGQSPDCSLNVKPDSKDTIAGQRKTDKPDSL